MLALEKMNIGRIVWSALLTLWLLGLLWFSFAPVPNQQVQFNLPLNISNQNYWVHASGETFAGGPSYIVHQNTTPEFVHEHSAGSALCTFDSEHNRLDCGWVQENIFHRGTINLNQRMPSHAIHYTWIGNGHEFHASRGVPLIIYLTLSAFAAAMFWAFRM